LSARGYRGANLPRAVLACGFFPLRPFGAPHLFEIVELTRLGTKDVNDHIARIDEHPIAEGHPFDTCIANAFLFQPLDELVGDCAHMALGAAGRDDHGIAERSLACQVDADDVISLGVLERLDDQVGERGGSRGSAFRAARFEFRELMMQNVRPQRKNPSSVLLRLCFRINTSTWEMCITFIEFSRQLLGAAGPQSTKGSKISSN